MKTKTMSKNFNTMNNKSLNLKTMTTMTTNFLKNTTRIGMAAVLMMALGTANAQTDPSTTDTALQTGIVYGAGSTSGSVRVIDNKGTIKYLQSSNGISSISNTTANGDVTTTTFQLGGTLTDNTYIDANGNIFALNGLETATLDAATSITNGSDGSGTTDSGWALLVRDEATGKTQKLLLSDLLSSAYNETTVDASFITTPTITFAPGITDLPTAPEKIWVYRNGAKLRSGKDYTIAGAIVTLVPGTSGSQAAPNDWALYAGDIIEVKVLSF